MDETPDLAQPVLPPREGKQGHSGAPGFPRPINPCSLHPPALPLVLGLPSNSPTATEYPAGRWAFVTPGYPSRSQQWGRVPSPAAHPGTHPRRPYTLAAWGARGPPATAGTRRGSA